MQDTDSVAAPSWFRKTYISVFTLLYAYLTVLFIAYFSDLISTAYYPTPTAEFQCQLGGCIARDLALVAAYVFLVPVFLFPFYSLSRSSLKEAFLSNGIFRRNDIQWLFYALVFVIVRISVQHAEVWGNIPKSSWDRVSDSLLNALPLFIGVSVAEEFVCRVFVQGQMLRVFHHYVSIAISTLFFTVLHQGSSWPIQGSPSSNAYVWFALSGILLGYSYFKTERVLVPILMHTLINTVSTVTVLNWVNH